MIYYLIFLFLFLIDPKKKQKQPGIWKLTRKESKNSKEINEVSKTLKNLTNYTKKNKKESQEKKEKSEIETLASPRRIVSTTGGGGRRGSLLCSSGNLKLEDPSLSNLQKRALVVSENLHLTQSDQNFILLHFADCSCPSSFSPLFVPLSGYFLFKSLLYWKSFTEQENSFSTSFYESFEKLTQVFHFYFYFLF